MADGLAGESAAEDIHTERVFVDPSHVGVTRNVGPMPSEDSSAELIGFALPIDAHTCAFKAEVEASDA